MNMLKLAIVAATLTIGSGAALADAKAPALNARQNHSVMTVDMTRSIELGGAGRGTIFGHAVEGPRAARETVQVWGHSLER